MRKVLRAPRHLGAHEQRLHSHCGDVPPAESKGAFYAAYRPTPPGSETIAGASHQT